MSRPSHPNQHSGTAASVGRVASHRRPVGDYTLVHAGHQVRLGPVAFWIVVGTLVIMGAWTVTTATYFAFRDDVLTRLIARQAEMQFAYEDRIAELRAQVDRSSSRQLLDQEQFDQKLSEVFKRQQALEARAAALNALPDPTSTGSIRQPARAMPQSDTLPAVAPKPSPISDTVIFTPPPDREARLESRIPAATKSAAKLAAIGFDGALARLQSSLDRVETRQATTLNSLEEGFDSKAQRMRGVLTELGVETRKAPPMARAMGGPFVSVRPPADAGTFERQLYRISLARAQVDYLSRTLVGVPVRKPVLGELDQTSGFGVRVDPFIGRPAMHTGLDFRGNIGDPIRATAAGTVSSAGWSGGYGKMVEVDHGNGLATRYGHMSEIEVKVGQPIKIGQELGRLGSTGRSTGPHLHYETRVEGEAVDPLRFLRAGVRLGSAL